MMPSTPTSCSALAARSQCREAPRRSGAAAHRILHVAALLLHKGLQLGAGGLQAHADHDQALRRMGARNLRQVRKHLPARPAPAAPGKGRH